ncbi:MAG: STAS domain-containing protein [Phycisphaerales bacterium]|nr:STAS domain-containing protein [Phycisphaerales bacterium]
MRFDMGQCTDSVQSKGSDKTKGSKTNTQLLSITKENAVYRVRLVSGELRSIDTTKLRAEIAGLHKPGNPPVVVFSMRRMDSLASGCLGAFAELSTDLERIGGALVLYNIPKEIAKILRKTKLDRIISTAKTCPQASKRALAMKKKYAEASRMNAA